MGDVAKGIKSFKKGMAEEDTPAGGDTPRAIEHEARSGESVQRDTTKSG